ncbi:hypothetical protein GCM10011517_04410 [Actibacterium pelagium]|uniref:Uncharacterized protein n=2 Tax=Actibacterium pelagium TaxID=2029103 RepID=A0A917ABR3_9RHOB|nr:hypothetical protein GCM10011517_04410 [Actibacterium pelagium]
MGEIVGIVAGQSGGGGGGSSAPPPADWGGFGASDPMSLLMVGAVAAVGIYIFFLR